MLLPDSFYPHCQEEDSGDNGDGNDDRGLMRRIRNLFGLKW